MGDAQRSSHGAYDKERQKSRHIVSKYPGCGLNEGGNDPQGAKNQKG